MQVASGRDSTHLRGQISYRRLESSLKYEPCNLVDALIDSAKAEDFTLRDSELGLDLTGGAGYAIVLVELVKVIWTYVKNVVDVTNATIT